jgi:hypothetical protein
MRRIFWGLCRNWFLIDPYITFRAVPILASNLRRYSKSKNDSLTWRISDSAFECLKEYSASRRVIDSPTRGAAMVSWGVAIQIFILYHRFSEL